ncbi:MAG TPA: hypothetical protein P5123_00250 [Spirochaetota bacterium]|nr:hypothetical protein [Spirochaetota bacterium]
MNQVKKDLFMSLAEQTALRSGIEIYDIVVQFRKGVVRVDIRIDNGATVSHNDCSLFCTDYIEVLKEHGLENEAAVEVSSPGLKRKIRNHKEWLRFEGAPVKVTYSDEKGSVTVKGVAKEVLKDSVVVVENKKKHVIGYDTIRHANLDY